jgi:hypothetical protein
MASAPSVSLRLTPPPGGGGSERAGRCRIIKTLRPYLSAYGRERADPATDGLLAFDARAMLKGLGFIRFNPESDCTHS